jgi:hypothetical protein
MPFLKHQTSTLILRRYAKGLINQAISLAIVVWLTLKLLAISISVSPAERF